MRYNTLDGATLIDYCIEKLKVDYIVHLKPPCTPISVTTFALDLNRTIFIENYNPFRNSPMRERIYNIKDYFLDIINPSEEELTMFELETEVDRFVILLLFSLVALRLDLLASGYSVVWLEKRGFV